MTTTPNTLSLPVLPLRDLVIFPGTTIPVNAGRPGTLNAVQTAIKEHDRQIFAVSQNENHDEVAPERLHTIGTIARIGQMQRSHRGIQLLVTGVSRGIALRFREKHNYFEAVVREAEELLPLDPEDPAVLAMQREVRSRASELSEKSGLPEEVAQQVLQSAETPGQLADVVATYLDIDVQERQKLLEIFSVEERLRRVLVLVQRQISVIDAQQDIQSRVQRELGDRQREMVLREQLKAIQDELGEGDGEEELEDLRRKLADLDLPPATRKEIDREFGRVTRMGRDSMEYQVMRSYLETVTELPWNERSEEALDLPHSARILDEDHYGLADVKNRVLEHLAVLQLQTEADAARERESEAAPEAKDDPDRATDRGSDGGAGDAAPTDERRTRIVKGPILLFAGPPGVGKTSIAQSIARAMGREYVRISLGGARDEADIRGHRRTYVGALPGRILQGMRQAGTKNPVFLLDEIDKLGVSYQGDPASALLEVLDPAQNNTFVDHYLGVPFDLSEVLFIATANFVQSIPGPLLDRMEVVEFTGYTEAEKLEIARRYLVPRRVRESGLTGSQITFSDAALGRVISRYTRESGVRQLEQEIGKLTRKVARRIASGETESIHLEEDRVSEYLGRPRVHPERASREDQVGVATGMYYTPVGGDIMFVEATSMPGRGELVLTGQLGDVMKESARAAWSYARSRAAQLLIDEKVFERDVHIHVPAGAIPKDGPSAGVSLATALVSALSGVQARKDIAMTGEITLTGRILPIGGVKEKVLGAVRAGISEVILPHENAADLEELPGDVREALTIHLVRELDEVLELALRGGIFREKHLQFTGE